MRGTDWQEVNRKITEFYNAIKECEFFFVRSGKFNIGSQCLVGFVTAVIINFFYIF